MDDDDAVIEWDETGATVVESEAITAPHAVLQLPGYEVGRADGCKACCASCQEEVFAALESVCRSKGLSDSEIAHLLRAVRREVTPT